MKWIRSQAFVQEAAKVLESETSTASQALTARYLTEEAQRHQSEAREKFAHLSGAYGFTYGEIEQAWEEAVLDMAQEIGERRWLGESK